jgi:hypothetical protein
MYVEAGARLSSIGFEMTGRAPDCSVAALTAAPWSRRLRGRRAIRSITVTAVMLADGAAQTEADHFMKCPGCGEWFDMRGLGQVLAHVHDHGIEISEGFYLDLLT